MGFSRQEYWRQLPFPSPIFILGNVKFPVPANGAKFLQTDSNFLILKIGIQHRMPFKGSSLTVLKSLNSAQRDNIWLNKYLYWNSRKSGNWNGSLWLKLKCWQVFDPHGHSRGQVFPFSFYLHWPPAFLGSWSFLYLQTQCIAFLTAYLTSLLLLASWAPQHLPAHLPDTGQQSRPTPDRKSVV